MKSLTPLRIPPATDGNHAVRLDQIGSTEAVGLLPVDIGTVTYDHSGDVVGVTVETVWGIDADGTAYYDPAGVTEGDEAALLWDPAGVYVLVAFEFEETP